MMTAKTECLHEDQLQGQSRKIAELEARADFKDQRIGELNNNMHEMDKKLDNLTVLVNEIRLQSSKDDYNIDARVTAIESKIETLKWVIGLTSIILAGLTFYFNYIH